jgi:Protein-L-isoaspartate(D-aspartate) O-methyltransferase (PCMT)
VFLPHGRGRLSRGAADDWSGLGAGARQRAIGTRAALPFDVGREHFIPAPRRDHAYEEVPLPLPGERATISCPHSYPLFYEPLGLKEGQTFLEVDVGSGYGTALAREVVGREGLVVGIDLDAATLGFAWGIWTGPATAPRFFFTATANWATRRTPPTTGSASRRPVRRSRRH